MRIAEKSNCITESQFWHGIAILISNYHALNKQIFQVLITQVEKFQNGQKLNVDSNEEELQLQLQKETRTCESFKILFKLLTKKLANNVLATGVVDFKQRTYECHFPNESFDDFLVRWHESELEVKMLTERPAAKQGNRWAEFVLLPKLLSWSQSKSEGTGQAQPSKSLKLVDVEKYNDLYKALKHRHAQRLLTYWQEVKESTDPLKFIYEDLAIAAYLITLWSCTQNEPSACVFADLGCGNGLLVHVLNAEGYKGYGFDIRKRKLWTHYPADIQLFELAIEPKAVSLPSDVNWLIGNHSDELSPWLPVLAARLRTKYFLLPCCPFELSGLKFQRRNTGISAYQDFFQYARQLSEKCGFETLEDRLKIPSTKRMALIGLKCSKTYADIEYYVQEELRKYATGDEDNGMSVRLREKTELVRNCTKVERTILDFLVLKIFKMLLDNSSGSEAATWNPGKKLSMREIAQSLTREELRGIKSECGGIKTLLRNKHEVFQFCGSDLIGIRQPISCAGLHASKAHTIKRRACFFKLNHPQGCPLSDEECSFVH